MMDISGNSLSLSGKVSDFLQVKHLVLVYLETGFNCKKKPRGSDVCKQAHLKLETKLGHLALLYYIVL